MEVGRITVIPEDDSPLDPAHHHVVEGLRGIEARLAGHGDGSLAQHAIHGNVVLDLTVGSMRTDSRSVIPFL